MSLLYHYHFSEPASIIEYPETHYDYVIGEFVSWFIILISVFLHIPIAFFLFLRLFLVLRNTQHRFLIKEDLRASRNQQIALRYIDAL